MGRTSVQSVPVGAFCREVRLHVLHHEVHAHQVLQGAGEAVEEQADSNVLPDWDFHDARRGLRDDWTCDYQVSCSLKFFKAMTVVELFEDYLRKRF